ncbi:hypothetical protein NWFMUON74_31070 [Nocardia wallacei]|uniref:Uncharacterized protein n=1 Tax=Nocardia wallacei TaxID=480035 RepID=A0A7G1KJD6_9NOCA|nr:hypothetical protein NWFMUON74_31070 [Nocardia wallacei]
MLIRLRVAVTVAPDTVRDALLGGTMVAPARPGTAMTAADDDATTNPRSMLRAIMGGI